MLSVSLLMISRSRRISSSVGYWSFCGYWPCWNGEYEKPEICSGQLGAETGRLISAQKPVNRAAMASTTTRLSPNLRDDITFSGSKRSGTKIVRQRPSGAHPTLRSDLPYSARNQVRRLAATACLSSFFITCSSYLVAPKVIKAGLVASPPGKIQNHRSSPYNARRF